MGYFHEGWGQHIEQSAKEFCQNVIRKDFDKFVKAKKFPREVFEEMGKAGFLGAMISEKYGGAGMNMQQYAVLMESLASYGGGSIALTLIAHHSLAAMHILYAGTEEQKRTFLPQLASGKMIGAWCLTEPDAGSDAFGKGMKTTALLSPDRAHWIINGSKQYITNGSVANLYVVNAKVDSSNPMDHSYSTFIVTIPCKGFVISRPETNKIGMHASDTSAVIFTDAVVDLESKMGGDGRQSTYQVLNNSRIGISALACGLMRSALSEAMAYAGQRKTFGKPIAEYQGVSFPLADASAELTSSWAMVEKAALAADKGTLTPKLSMETKLKTTESAFKSCLSCLFVFGGLGYMMDSRVAQDFTDALLLRIGEGTDNMQRLGIVRALFPKE